MLFPRFRRPRTRLCRATGVAGKNGMMTLIHCEDYPLIEASRAQLATAGTTSLRYYPASRPVVTEAVAVQRAVAIAEVTGAPIYIVHLSSARALEVCVQAQSRGVPVYVETRPLYLHLTRERFDEPDGPKYVGAPPAPGTSRRGCALVRHPPGRRAHRLQRPRTLMLADKLDPSLSSPTPAQAWKTYRRSCPCSTRRGSVRGVSR